MQVIQPHPATPTPPPSVAQFIATHGDMATWPAVDFEVVEHLIETAPAGPSLTPAVLRLRTLARAAHYNPDIPHQLDALACVAGEDAPRLHAMLTGRIPLDHVAAARLSRALNAPTVASDEDIIWPHAPARRPLSQITNPTARRQIARAQNR